MSAIFVLVTVALVLLVAAVTWQEAYATSGSNSQQLTDIVDILGSGLEVGALVPIVLFMVLFVGVLGIWGRL